MMNETTSIEKLKDYVASAQKIAIIPHRNPDGDALGSSLGLWHVLKQICADVQVISPNDFPDFLSWMPGAQEIVIFEKEKEKAISYVNSADLIFALDFNALHRTGELMEAALKSVKAPFVMIDHHQMPDDFASVTFSDVNFGSTCELLFVCLQQAGLASLIDQKAATCLYTGIVTDSGSFKFQKTTGNTHRVVAQLIDLGIDNPSIHNQLFNNNSYKRLQLLGRALENMVVLPEFQVAYTTLSQKELYEFQYQKGDTEGIVNYALSIKGVHFAAIFIENKEEGIIKISFRSEGDIDVNEFARTYFHGGGHVNAAGGKSFLSLHKTVEEFVHLIQNKKPDEINN